MSNFKLQCPIEGHKLNEIMWICLSQSCSIENKAICQDCLDFHYDHYRELIKLNNLNLGIKHLRNSIQEMIKSFNQQKDKLLDTMNRIIKIIENNYNECIKPLVDFDELLQKVLNTNQTHDFDELRSLIVKLGENSTLYSNKDQASEQFLFIKQSMFDKTIKKYIGYCSNIDNKINLQDFQVNQQNTNLQTSSSQQQNIPPDQVFNFAKQAIQTRSLQYPEGQQQNPFQTAGLTQYKKPQSKIQLIIKEEMN